MKLKTRHSREEDVQDKTPFSPLDGVIHEVFRGREGDGIVAGRSEQPLQGFSCGLIVIYQNFLKKFINLSSRFLLIRGAKSLYIATRDMSIPENSEIGLNLISGGLDAASISTNMFR